MTDKTTPNHDNAPTPNGEDGETNDGFEALALLAGLTGTTAEQMRLLKIITDPALANGSTEGETHLEIADYYEENYSGYPGSDFYYEMSTVADFLYSHYDSDPQAPDFTFGFISSSDGEIGGISVTARCGTDWNNRLDLHDYIDTKHATYDRSATGLAAALAIAQALDATYQSLATKARKRGLLLADTDVLDQAQAAYYLAARNDTLGASQATQVAEALKALLDAQGIYVGDPEQ
jgi:hypothetical protein